MQIFDSLQFILRKSIVGLLMAEKLSNEGLAFYSLGAVVLLWPIMPPAGSR